MDDSRTNGRYVDKMDDKWTGIWPSKGSIQKCQPALQPHVFGSTRRVGAPEMIRTSDLLLRRQALYPAELRAHTCLSVTLDPSANLG